MNWPWKKKKLSFAETAKFNWEADTNEELRQKLNELAKQYPTLREGEYREKLLSLFRERGLDLNAEQLDMLLLLRQKTDQMLLERKAERQGQIFMRRGTMNIQKALSGAALTVALEGRLDTTTAPKLEEELRGSVDGVSRLVFDLAKLEYISSAGLRVLLAMQKLMNRQGAMLLRNVNEAVMEVFEVTGFSDILRIE